jgi:hypothetical protein
MEVRMNTILNLLAWAGAGALGAWSALVIAWAWKDLRHKAAAAPGDRALEQLGEWQHFYDHPEDYPGDYYRALREAHERALDAANRQLNRKDWPSAELRAREADWAARLGLKAKKVDEEKIRSLDDLALVLNSLFARFGGTLSKHYMFFTFGGKVHLLVQLDNAGFKSITEWLKVIGEQDVNEALVSLLR